MILKSCQRQFLPLPNHESYHDSDHFFNPKIMVNPWSIATIFYPDMVITKSLSIVASDNNLATVWTKVLDDVCVLQTLDRVVAKTGIQINL
jgi:hypothetical protein